MFRDYTAFCSIMEALSFREFVGEQRILSYIHDLAVKAGHELASLWGTEVCSLRHVTATLTTFIGASRR